MDKIWNGKWFDPNSGIILETMDNEPPRIYSFPIYLPSVDEVVYFKCQWEKYMQDPVSISVRYV